MASPEKPVPPALRFTEEIGEVELRQPDFITVLKVIWHSVRGYFRERPGQIIGSAFLLLMLWGYHGQLELLRGVWRDWWGPGTDPTQRPVLIPGVPWDHELISFWAGALLLVVVPMLLIKFAFKEPLSRYGLGLPLPGRRLLALYTFLALMLMSLPAFYLGSRDAGMRDVYPLFRGLQGGTQFILYQLCYLPFFVAIEFIFRGYLLFGLAGAKEVEMASTGGEAPGNRLYFHRYALLIQMLSYTAWHLGKPLPELWGTLAWGLGAGALAYAVRSIWPVVLAHWLLNVFLDWLILHATG